MDDEAEATGDDARETQDERNSSQAMKEVTGHTGRPPEPLEHLGTPAEAMSRSAWRLAGILCVPLGIVFWLNFSLEWVSDVQMWLVLGVAAFAAIWPVSGRLGAWLETRPPLPPAGRTLVSVAVFVVTGSLGVLIQFVQGADLWPGMCDEYSYSTGAYLASEGRLWSPGHEHGDFFTTFQVIASPVYTSIYFPGAAIWMSPAALLDRLAAGPGLGGTLWVMTWLASAGAAALAYRLVAGWMGDVAGLAVVAVMFATQQWRGSGMMVMAQAPATILGLTCVYGYVRWRASALAASRRDGPIFPAEGQWAWMGWAALSAFAACWAVLTRPMDGLAYGVPVFAAVMATVAISRRLSRRVVLLSFAAAAIGIAPWAMLQLTFNKGVTDSYSTTPFNWYNEFNIPGTTFGGDRELDRMPLNPTAHFQASYLTFSRPFVEDSRPQVILRTFWERRVPEYLFHGLPHGMILLLIPAAVLGLLRYPQALPLAGMWVLGIFLHLPYAFFLGQYAFAAIPSLALCAVLGVYGYAGAAGRIGSRGRGVVFAICLLGMLAVATREVPGLGRLLGQDNWYNVPQLRNVDRVLESIDGRAVVFITPPLPNDLLEACPVYNLGVSHPDRARVVRAHDLGGRNPELVDYYARHDPGREMYHLNRTHLELTYLGRADELAAEDRAALWQRFRDLSRQWREAPYPQFEDDEPWQGDAHTIPPGMTPPEAGR